MKFANIHTYSMADLEWLSSLSAEETRSRFFGAVEAPHEYTIPDIAVAVGQAVNNVHVHCTRKKLEPSDLLSVVYYLAAMSTAPQKIELIRAFGMGHLVDQKYDYTSLADVAKFVAAWGKTAVRKEMAVRFDGRAEHFTDVRPPGRPKRQ